jgi:hypothetical protein
MRRVNGAEICAEGEVQAFRLIDRCVRRTLLCGKERRLKKDYSSGAMQLIHRWN